MNKGAQMLSVYFQSAQEAAARVGVKGSMFSLLLAGKRKPSIEVAYAIQREWGVPMEAWLEEVGGLWDPTEAEKLAPARGSAPS